MLNSNSFPQLNFRRDLHKFLVPQYTRVGFERLETILNRINHRLFTSEWWRIYRFYRFLFSWWMFDWPHSYRSSLPASNTVDRYRKHYTFHLSSNYYVLKASAVNQFVYGHHSQKPPRFSTTHHYIPIGEVILVTKMSVDVVRIYGTFILFDVT